MDNRPQAAHAFQQNGFTPAITAAPNTFSMVANKRRRLMDGKAFSAGQRTIGMLKRTNGALDSGFHFG